MKFLVLMSLLSSTAFAGAFKLDASHTTVGFKVKHLVISTINGRFTKFDGTFNFDEKTKALADLKVSIDASSINTDEADRDKHLKSADFFDVEKFKTLEFTSTKATKKSGNNYSVVGDLTIHGVKKSITMAVELSGPVIDPWKNKKMAFVATAQINRADFGLTWNKALEAGGVVVAEKVNIIIEGESSAQ